MSLEAVKFNKETCSLSILDQLLIPYQSEYLDVKTIDDGFQVIKKMQVRGAPAIAIVGCFSICSELNLLLAGKLSTNNYNLNDFNKFKKNLIERIEFLITSRPTAVNLLNACTDLEKLINNGGTNDSPKELFDSILKYSIDLFEDDLKNNFKIGENGCSYINNELGAENFKGEFSVLTICNTGSLATSGHGTALGIIRSLWDISKLNPKNKDNSEIQNSDTWLSHVYCLETRPYNQGKLTSFELKYEKIPFTLITDNMVSLLIDTLNNKDETLSNQRGLLNYKSPVKFIIVGADRIVKNGDLANKIGTFQLSLISSIYDSVKFIGAAPITTIDFNKNHGDEIVIENRPKKELTCVLGGEVDFENDKYLIDESTNKVKLNRIKFYPEDINVWNPAFDITPHKYIDCIVTEKNYITKDSNGEFNLSV